MGSGKFSRVYKIDVEESQGSFAVKQLKREVGQSGYLDNILNEVAILQSLSHPHIVSFIGKYRNQDYYNIILEHCNGGDLNSYIRKYGPLNEEDTRHVIRQVTEALAYIHEEANVIHRDIKTSNLLVHWNNLGDKISCQSYDFCSH